MKVVWWYDKKYTNPDLKEHPHEHAATSMRLEFIKRGIDLVTYGKGWGTTIDDARVIEKKENPDFFVIFCCQNELRNLDKVKCLKVMKCADPWANIWFHKKFAIKNKIDLLLPIYWDAVHKYREVMKKVRVEPMPLWTNPDWFYDMKLERIYDVFLTGAFGSGSHPLRAEIVNKLNVTTDINKFIKSGHHLSFTDYIKTINQSKIIPFGCVELPYHLKNNPVKFAIGKWTEGMSCGTMVMADKPKRAEDLHYIPDYNFVEVDTSNFMDKLKYYLRHMDELRQIAKHGLETIRKYHTVQVRATEVLKFMESI